MENLELIKKMSKNLNGGENISIPYFNKFCKIVSIYFNHEDITEISVNDFNKLSGLNKNISRLVLISLNNKIFS